MEFSLNIRDVKLRWFVCDDSLDCLLYLAYFMEHYQGNVDIDPLFEVNTCFGQLPSFVLLCSPTMTLCTPMVSPSTLLMSPLSPFEWFPPRSPTFDLHRQIYLGSPTF